MMAWRILAETHSLTTTVAMMISRMSDTWVQASMVIAALSGRPIRRRQPGPAPSTRGCEMPAKSRQDLRHDAIGGDLRAARAGRAHRLDLALVDLLDRLPDRQDAGKHAGPMIVTSISAQISELIERDDTMTNSAAGRINATLGVVLRAAQ